MAAVALAILLGLLGFCFLVGWAQAFRERLYLLFLAVCLMILAVAAVVPAGKTRVWVLVAASAFFVLAFAFAARETIRNMQAVKEQRKALEQEMWAYLEELKKKERRPGGESQG